MNLPIDLSIVKDDLVLFEGLETIINQMYECKYEADKMFIYRDESLKIIKELKKRNWRVI